MLLCHVLILYDIVFLTNDSLLFLSRSISLLFQSDKRLFIIPFKGGVPMLLLLLLLLLLLHVVMIYYVMLCYVIMLCYYVMLLCYMMLCFRHTILYCSSLAVCPYHSSPTNDPLSFRSTVPMLMLLLLLLLLLISLLLHVVMLCYVMVYHVM